MSTARCATTWRLRTSHAYPTDSAYAAATSSALETIGPRIRSAGRLVVANVCCEDTSPGNWARSLRYVSDAMTEQFVKWGDGDASLDTYAWDWGAGGWRTHVAMVEEAARQDKILLANSHSSPGDLGGCDTPWRPCCWQPARAPLPVLQRLLDADLVRRVRNRTRARAARDARRALSTGVQMRTFENGLVLVNPTTETVRVDLDGPYTVSGVGPTTHVDMASRSGLLLRRTPFSALLGAVSEPLTIR
jgi:hypothetical protein